MSRDKAKGLKTEIGTTNPEINGIQFLAAASGS
jgi:hypothetical protein